MANVKKPTSNQKEIKPHDDERAAEAFIATAGTPAKPHVEESRKTPVMLRFDPDLLKRVDTAAKRRGVSRSAWIQFTVSRALDQGEG